MTPLAFTAQCVAICGRGFDNHFAWTAWLNKRRRQIDQLPPPLRKRVLEAHSNSGPKEISK